MSDQDNQGRDVRFYLPLAIAGFCVLAVIVYFTSSFVGFYG